jgi:hypothetical protein
MHLTTRRLLLREFMEEDWEAVLAYQTDPLYLRYNPYSFNIKDGKRMAHKLSMILVGLVMGLLLAGVMGAEAKPQKTPPLPLVERVAAQPLRAWVKRLTDALDYLGSPLPQRVKARLEKAASEPDEARAAQMVQEALDPYCLLAVNINPESWVKVATGPARPDTPGSGQAGRFPSSWW